MNSISEKNFAMVVKFGPAVIGVCILLNIWSVMRYREEYRDSIKTEMQVQQLVNGDRILGALLQEFSARANSDPHIAEILRNAQAAPQPMGTAPRPTH